MGKSILPMKSNEDLRLDVRLAPSLEEAIDHLSDQIVKS